MHKKALGYHQFPVAGKIAMVVTKPAVTAEDLSLAYSPWVAEPVKEIASDPIVFACSNPAPEIDPAVAKAVRSDVIIATGRSDYPNQVNNVLAFPFIFRGALDAKATKINEELKIAAVHAIKDLAKAPATKKVHQIYKNELLTYGKEYILPKPFDERLFENVSKAVKDAAIKSGVCRA